MDPTKIGNARQQDDNRIAVLNAIPLGDCYRQLTDIFRERELRPTDIIDEFRQMYNIIGVNCDPCIANDSDKSVIAADKATNTLRNAIAKGQFRVWRVHDAKELPVTAMLLDHDNVRYGIFKSFERPEPDMQGATLWVKLPEWEHWIKAQILPKPQSAENICNKKLIEPAKRKPGPRADERWPKVIETVLAEAVKSGYRQPPARGEQQAIIELLLIEMERASRKAYGVDTGRKHALTLISRLPPRDPVR